MSGVCYPDSLIGSIPNLYYYAANNPSEATIAKRRSYANTISYLTPPAENAGLYKGLKELKELISSYQGMRESGRAEQICATIIETARQCNLDKVRTAVGGGGGWVQAQRQCRKALLGIVAGRICMMRCLVGWCS